MKQFVLLSLLVGLALSYSVNYNGQKVIRIFFDDANAQRPLLQKAVDKLSMDIWHEDLPESVDLRIRDATEQAAIDSMGFTYAVIIDDLQSRIEEESRQLLAAKADPDWHTKYHPYAEIVQFGQDTARQNSSLARFQFIGQSLESRELPVLVITSPNGSPAQKTAIFVQCQIHAREWISAATCMYFIDQVLAGYGRDPRITNLLDQTVWHFLLVTNPDGYVYSWNSDRLWRKNRNPNGPGALCYGVDLNRNYRTQWRSEFLTCSETYSGAGPFSEPETRAIESYAATLPNLNGFMDVHSYGQYFLYPYGYATTPLPPDQQELVATGNLVVNTIRSINGLNFRAGNSMSTLYQTFGVSIDYFYVELGAVYSYTIENRDTGLYGFVLPPSQIVAAGREVTAAFLVWGERIAANSNKK